MTTSDLLTTVRDAIAADQNLAAWCLDHLGSAPTVWLGIDPAKPPKEDDYPIVCVLGADQSRGDNRGEITWELQLGVGVINDEISESGQVRTFTGLLQAAALREQVEDAVYRARIAGVGSSGASAEEWYYPMFVAYSTIEVSALKTTRRGLP